MSKNNATFAFYTTLDFISLTQFIQECCFIHFLKYVLVKFKFSFINLLIFIILPFICFTSFREQDEAYINSLRWLTLVELEPAYTHVSCPLYHCAPDYLCFKVKNCWEGRSSYIIFLVATCK